MNIIEAEQVWKFTRDAHEHFNTFKTHQTEQDAWDTYTDLCNDIDQCYEIGCRVTVPE